MSRSPDGAAHHAPVVCPFGLELPDGADEIVPWDFVISGLGVTIWPDGTLAAFGTLQMTATGVQGTTTRSPRSTCSARTSSRTLA